MVKFTAVDHISTIFLKSIIIHNKKSQNLSKAQHVLILSYKFHQIKFLPNHCIEGATELKIFDGSQFTRYEKYEKLYINHYTELIQIFKK